MDEQSGFRAVLKTADGAIYSEVNYERVESPAPSLTVEQRRIAYMRGAQTDRFEGALVWPLCLCDGDFITRTLEEFDAYLNRRLNSLRLNVLDCWHELQQEGTPSGL